MELAKSIIQIIIIVIVIAGLCGYAAMTIFFHRNGKKMNEKQKKTVVIAKLILSMALICLAIVLNVMEAQKENLIIILLAGIYYAEQIDFLLKVQD